MASSTIRRYRSVFLSDVHLGTPACRAQALLAFLDGVHCERLYLLGDIVDGLRLQRRWFWPAAHAAVLDRILALARLGVAVIYVPGNHDAFARTHDGFSLEGVRIATEAEHIAADGRRYLLAHGDAYDPGSHSGAVVKWAGDLAYRGLMRLDRAGRWGLRRAGLGDISSAAWTKKYLIVARRVVARFEAALAEEARRRGFDGVICGHIHSAVTRNIGGIAYVNCGDWVDSCSAVVETTCGALDVVHWPHEAPTPSRIRVSRIGFPVWSP